MLVEVYVSCPFPIFPQLLHDRGGNRLPVVTQYPQTPEG